MSKPVLYKPDATDYRGSGYGPLNMAVRCEVSEKLNDAPTLEMDIFCADPLFKNIEIGSIIGAEPNKTDPRQAFIVEQITKPINGIATIYATHIAQHRAKLIPVAPFTAQHVQTALDALNNNALEVSPFTFHRTGANTSGTMAPEVPHSMRDLMGGTEGSILDVYGGEWGYDNFNITLYQPRRGSDNGVRVLYGENMKDLKLSEAFSWDNSATGCVGYWKKDQTIIQSAPQYAPIASNYPYKKTVAVDFSEQYEDAPTVAELNNAAAAWIAGKGLPALTMEVQFDHLQLEGGKNIALGDTVHIYSAQYNFNAARRICEIVYDVLGDEYKKVTIGTQKTTINEAIAGASGSNDKTAGSSASGGGRLYYGEVDSTSTATAFTAQIDGITAYEKGLAVVLKNGVVTSATNYTININGLGAKPVYRSLAAQTRDTNYFNVNYTMLFVYEERVAGGDWLMYMGYDANTNTIGYQIRTNSRTIPVNGQTGRYRLLFSSQTNKRLIPANTSSSTSATAAKTVNDTPINPHGEILYYSATTVLASGASPGTATLWEQYAITLGYSFNRTGAALTLTPNEPVYIKCTPRADGSAIIDPDEPFTQNLPTTADGKIYIFLGTAYSATAVEMVVRHPVYYYSGGGIRIWTGGSTT